jgi:hypothetical protein
MDRSFYLSEQAKSRYATKLSPDYCFGHWYTQCRSGGGAGGGGGGGGPILQELMMLMVDVSATNAGKDMCLCVLVGA